MTVKPAIILFSQMDSSVIVALSIGLDTLFHTEQFSDLRQRTQSQLLQLRELLSSEAQKRHMKVYPAE